ncbi:MAG: hypothetical protein EBR09_15820, partial [Proteobacteria bacterium]|nr:hypothetical protein [Pseudomonadota bacterium]
MKPHIFKAAFAILALQSQSAATASASFLCVAGQLYKPDGSQVYVGHDACRNAKLFGASACVAGVAYYAKGQSMYVGADACKNAKL